MMSLMISCCHNVILYSLFLSKSGGIRLHSWICSCTVEYAVALFDITRVRSCIIISHFSTVHIVKSVQLHLFLHNYISWCCDNLVHKCFKTVCRKLLSTGMPAVNSAFLHPLICQTSLFTLFYKGNIITLDGSKVYIITGLKCCP